MLNNLRDTIRKWKSYFCAMAPNDTLTELLTQSKGAIDRFKKKSKINSLIRLVSFLMFIYGVYLGWGHGILVVFVVLIFGFLFANLVKRQSYLREKLKLEKAFSKNCQEELDILSGKWRDRTDGSEFIHRDHPFAADLNVFGPYSLFQYLNRSKTNLARERLAGWLSHELIDEKSIERERSIIGELAAYPYFLLRLISHAEFTVADAKLFAAIKSWSTDFVRKPSTFYTFLTTRLIPAYAIVCTLLLISDTFTFTNYLLALLVPAAFIASKLNAHQKQFDEVLTILSKVDQFESILAMVRSHPFESTELKALIDKVNLAEGKEGISALRTVVGAIESRNNVIVAIVLNLILMWDFQSARRLRKWKSRYASELHSWLELANIFETYASLGLYVFGHPEYVYAEITDNEAIRMDRAKHVLMDESAIPNSFRFSREQGFMIVTGANMAGKSTFLRMVGTTMLLAMRGLPIPAEVVQFRPHRLFTSMLATDSLGENESYFFNELRRLRMMTDKLENGESLFVILDEILKGTNSKDKAEGSRRFIEKLLHLPVKGIIATHDLSLCQLGEEFPERVKNMKFEVGFKNDELHFEYMLEPGVCQNMNASFLLRKMGLTN